MLMPLQIERQYGASLDADYSFGTLEELKNYATTSALSYPGQILYCEDTDTVYKVNKDKTDVSTLDGGSEGGKVYTSLIELGLTADATLQDVVDALPKGGSALLGVKEFTNYQTIFPYDEGNDQFARVHIVKGVADGSCMYARWFRKDGAKEAIASFNINDNKFYGWRPIFTNYYTSLAQLGLTAPTTIGEAFNAMPDKSQLMLNVNNSANTDATVTDAPHNQGVLVINKHNNGRFSIEFNYSLGGNGNTIRKWVGSLKGSDGTGLNWKEIAYANDHGIKSYSSLADLGLDTTATINDIIGAMANSSIFTYKTDVFDYATEYNNVQNGTVVINKQSASRIQVLMTDKETGNLYIGRMDGTNKFVGWTEIITEKSDPYACASYTRLTGKEDLFTLPCGHYVTEKADTAYNYPITDSSTLTAHIYVLGHLNDPTNNKGYRIILYFDNKGRMYRINEWWGVFTDNGWQEIATKSYVDSKHNYSTTETAIGTWIDGKTIYRKTFTKSPTSDQATGNQVTINVATISGLTNVIDIQATAKLQNYNNTSAPIYAKIPFSEMWRSNSGSTGAAVYSIYVEGTTLKLRANSCVSEDIYYVTVEYTK